MLSKEGTDIFVVGESMYSFMKDYKPPAAAALYLFDMKKANLIGLKIGWPHTDVQALTRRMAIEVPVEARARGRQTWLVHRMRRTMQCALHGL